MPGEGTNQNYKQVKRKFDIFLKLSKIDSKKYLCQISLRSSA